MTRGFRMLEEVTGSNKKLLEVTEGYMRFQEVRRD